MTERTKTLNAAALRKKYREERDKRLRPDGNAQYIDLSGTFADFATDPHVPPLVRDPIREDVDVVVVGGGFGGLLAGAALREAGCTSLRIIEKGGDFGGTWYWNRYPGIRCDIDACTYIPLLEEVGTIPTEKYAHGREIFAHCQGIGRRYDLYSGAIFQTEVTRIVWDEARARWIVGTNRGDEIRAKFVQVGTGPTHRAKLPGIPGILDFKGRMFHSSRWDYDYTGGREDGVLTGLADKRVAVIGNGATGIQIIPEVAKYAQRLYHFQRTPSAVDQRNNRPMDYDWFKSQPSGWQKKRMDNFMLILLGVPQEEDLVNDRWTEVWSRFATGGVDDGSGASAEERAQLNDDNMMNELRARVASSVADPATAEALKPWYNLFCKRPLYSDEFLPAYNRPNVTLVDTKGRGVERITESGLVFDGKTYDVDCIIFATGFKVGAYTYETGGFEVKGRNGVTLAQKWENGVRSVHGTQMNGFPNFHIIGAVTQGTVTVNFPHATGVQARHGAELIMWCLRNNVKTMEVTQDAEERWTRQVAAKAVDRSKFDMDCTPGFFNNEGDNSRPTFVAGSYGGGAYEYFRIIEDWRKSGFKDDTIIVKA